MKELLPEVLNAEQYQTLKAHVDSRLTEVEKYIRESLAEMDDRHKQVMSYLLTSHDKSLEPKEEVSAEKASE